jgi:hypothetical protein
LLYVVICVDFDVMVQNIEKWLLKITVEGILDEGKDSDIGAVVNTE